MEHKLHGHLKRKMDFESNFKKNMCKDVMPSIDILNPIPWEVGDVSSIAGSIAGTAGFAIKGDFDCEVDCEDSWFRNHSAITSARACLKLKARGLLSDRRGLGYRGADRSLNPLSPS